MGPLQQGTYTVGYCYALELFPRSRRSVPALMSEMTWVGSTCVLCLIVYLVRDWRVYYYVTSLPFLSGVILFWIMPESIPWLFAKGKTDEAYKALKSMTAFMKNREEVIQSIETEGMKMQQERENDEEMDKEVIYPCYFVCTQKHIQKWSAMNAFAWFAVGMSYYAFNVYGVSFGDIYLNFFLLAIIEVPAVMCTSYIAIKLGRKLTAIVSYLVMGISIAFLFIGVSFASYAIALNVFFVVVGRFFATVSFTVIFLHASEMYPTSLRSMGIAIGTSSTRLGMSMTPFVREMDKLVSYLPTVIIVGFDALTAVIYFFLPETRRWWLPQTLEEVYYFKEDPKYQDPLCSCGPSPDLENLTQKIECEMQDK